MDARLLDEARTIIRDFVQLRPDETIAVVSDHEHRAEAEALTVAADAVGAAVISIDADQTVRRMLDSGEFWVDPPKHLVAALQQADVSLFTVDETYAFRLDHRVSSIFETGPNCSIFKLDAGMGSWGLEPGDSEAVTRDGKRIVAAIDGHDQVRITTARGTDLTLSVAGRPCLPIFPVPERGAPYGISVPLWGEYNWAPVEGTANGTLVIDGLTEAGRKMGTVGEPVVMTIVDGRVVDVAGGDDAEDFRRVFAIDEGAAVIAELGVGGNPKAMLGHETEKALLGTIHIGFGSNQTYPGGQNHSAVHIDGVARDVTLEVDGQLVISGGQVVVGAAGAL